METKIYNFEKEFTKFPGPRYKKLGNKSGEEFRVDVLENIFNDKKYKLIIDITGVLAFPPSFIDEAFVTLRKKYKDEFYKYIEIIGKDKDELIEEIEEYAKD